jgi:inosine/xanthosine triphosphate pyrophosphatase family protein
MAELPPEEKHRISHRGKALACAIEALRRLFAKG